MTALYIVGDVFDKVAELRRRRIRVALVLCSPPFLALRSYLPDGHPLKAKEIGSEANPAAYIDGMLSLVAELAHVLYPWGSIAFEQGDTYAGSGGAGGDYDPDGLRAGQNAFDGSAKARRLAGDFPVRDDIPRPNRSGRAAGWPLAKSLAGIPEAFMLSLAYGYNVLDRRGPDSPAGRWRVRNFKPWIRSNPPVGALGDKERPATSYITVATRDAARYFDLDAVRAPNAMGAEAHAVTARNGDGQRVNGGDLVSVGDPKTQNAAGAPPRDWWHHVDAVLDACLDDMAGKTSKRGNVGEKLGSVRRDGYADLGPYDGGVVGARGVHLRRRLETAGILTTLDAIDQSPKGYKGAHYAVWPPELVRLLVDEMCPRRVCTTCEQPSRRMNGALTLDSYRASNRPQTMRAVALADAAGLTDEHIAAVRAFGTSDAGKAPTLNNGAGKNRDHVKRLAAEAKAVLGGYFREFVQSTTAERASTWSDCGHGTWTPGVVLDPFVGSGTTLQVCSGMGRGSIGIDLDYTNVGLALGRVGVFLAVEWPPPDLDALEHRALGPGSPHPASYDRWSPLLADGRRRGVLDHRDEPGLARTEPAPITATYKRPPTRALPSVAGQLDLLGGS